MDLSQTEVCNILVCFGTVQCVLTTLATSSLPRISKEILDEVVEEITAN